MTRVSEKRAETAKLVFLEETEEDITADEKKSDGDLDRLSDDGE
jgi:hypothetical protein